MHDESRTKADTLRTYKAPWKGQLILACRKCRKRWKENGDESHLNKLKKEMKKGGRDGSFSILNVPCLKLCPKGGITMCTAEQMERNECSIVRSKRDLHLLLGASKRGEGPRGRTEKPERSDG